ncbi:hypothetical protein NK718_13985 [Alsobacter sp. SYSU M60028]|uniref:Serine/threonine protein kinase n=1 Tax=Alsobacter ponti TaxID=2962936 RepID=A0ABT1LHC4_9HYPH|nr:hypothetical protein [Alsobacter ponti]MCP8939633.1 hypothetical protein [Alsobacter ponti]
MRSPVFVAAGLVSLAALATPVMGQDAAPAATRPGQAGGAPPADAVGTVPDRAPVNAAAGSPESEPEIHPEHNMNAVRPPPETAGQKPPPAQK